MNIEDMRWALKNCTKYRNSYKWQNKVDKMSDNQVIAVYFRFKNSGNLLQ